MQKGLKYTLKIKNVIFSNLAQIMLKEEVGK